MAQYNVKFWRVDARIVRSEGPIQQGADTLHCGIKVIVDGGQWGWGDKAGPQTLNNGTAWSVDVTTTNGGAGNTAGGNYTLGDNDTVRIVWTALNAGNVPQQSRKDYVAHAINALDGKGTITALKNADVPNDLMGEVEVPGDISSDLGADQNNGLNCDGAVVGAAVQISAAEIANRTAANGTFNVYVKQGGYNSPQGCGRNSDYSSQLIIKKVG